MAKVKIEGNASGTGTFTIAAPNSNTDRTLTLPDETGTVVYENASGNVGIGTSSPDVKLHVQKSSTTLPTIAGDCVGVFSSNGTSALSLISGAGNSVLRFGDSSDEDVGRIVYAHAEEAMLFYTAASEAMRIDNSGRLLVGYTSSNGSYKLQVNSQIFATSATIATSDGRYKENIESLGGSLDLVKQLNPVQFSWKDHPVHEFDTETPTVGFIAQEVQQVLADKPYVNAIVKANSCVLEPEEYDEEGNITKEAVTEEFLGIAEGNMVALLTAALQEAVSKIEALETRIAALEA